MKTGLSRRQIVRGLAACTAGLGFAVSPSRPAASRKEGVCTLFPQATEGPFYFDPELVRSDITDGRPGTPLKLALRIIQAGPCTPVADARVDVWHADAGGVYSGYPGQEHDRTASARGKAYLRGTQMTDAGGEAMFRTIYPGWYPGRTPHIHLKVFLDEKTVLTGQIYFPDELSARIYRDRRPYAARPPANTTNAADFIFRRGEREGGGTVLAVEEKSGRIDGSLVIAVDRSGDTAFAPLGFGRFLQYISGASG